jgi:hypothetical protein
MRSRSRSVNLKRYRHQVPTSNKPIMWYVVFWIVMPWCLTEPRRWQFSFPLSDHRSDVIKKRGEFYIFNMSTQYRLVQSGKTASDGCSAGPRFVRAVAPRIYLFFLHKTIFWFSLKLINYYCCYHILHLFYRHVAYIPLILAENTEVCHVTNTARK